MHERKEEEDDAVYYRCKNFFNHPYAVHSLGWWTTTTWALQNTVTDLIGPAASWFSPRRRQSWTWWCPAPRSAQKSSCSYRRSPPEHLLGYFTIKHRTYLSIYDVGVNNHCYLVILRNRPELLLCHDTILASLLHIYFNSPTISFFYNGYKLKTT